MVKSLQQINNNRCGQTYSNNWTDKEINEFPQTYITALTHKNEIKTEYDQAQPKKT